VCCPHRQQDCDANKAQLNPDRQGLVVGIMRRDCRNAGLADSRAIELIANRAGTMAD
jgi:hypothetical protein